MNRAFAALVLALALIFTLLSYKIIDVPRGINGDEAALGYNAFLISKTGRDESGKLLPVFINPSNSDWKQPVSVYSTALVFRLFGVSYLNLRIVSVAMIAASAAILWMIFRKNIGKFALSAFALVSSPIVIIQSHLALENIAPIPLLLLMIFILKKYLEKSKAYFLVISGALLGVSAYSYYGMRVGAIAIYLVFCSWFVVGQKRAAMRPIVLFSTGFLPLMLLMYVLKISYPGALLGNYHVNGLPDLYTFFSRYFAAFDFTFLFFKGDGTPYHSTGYFGALLFTFLPIFVLGLKNALSDKKSLSFFSLLVLFVTPLLFGFVPDVWRASRMVYLMPFYSIVSAAAVDEIDRRWKKVLFAGSICLSLVALAGFLHDYWGDYAKRSASVFSTPMHRAFEAVTGAHKADPEAPICFEGGIKQLEPAQFNFFKAAYLPSAEVGVCNNILGWPKGAIVVANPDAISKEARAALSEISPLIGFYKVYAKNP